MLLCSGVSTPMVHAEKLTCKDGDPLSLEDATIYRALQYLSLTRPDIAFCVNRSVSIWLIRLKRILQYLRDTIHFGLCFNKSSSMLLSAFFYADWADNLNDRRSTDGYTIFFGGNLIAWSFRK
jgi:hypothetical protein